MEQETELNFRDYIFKHSRYTLGAVIVLTFILEILDFMSMSDLGDYYLGGQLGWYFLITMFLWFLTLLILAKYDLGRVVIRVLIFLSSFNFYTMMLNKEDK